MDQRGKRLLITALVFILLFLGIAGYFFIFKKDSSLLNPNQVDPNLFPFDERGNSIVDLPIINENEEPAEPEFTVDETDYELPRPRLRKITDFAVSGFISFIRPEKIIELVFNEKTNQEEPVEKTLSRHLIRYNEQKTGHIFEGLITEQSIFNKKITGTNLPVAEDITFNTEGSTGIMRYEQNQSISSFKITIPEPPQVPDYCKNPFIASKNGSKGVHVAQLQKYLSVKLNKVITSDGSYGNGTANFVRELERLFTVEPTGVFEGEVLTLANNDCDDIKSSIIIQQNTPRQVVGSAVSGFINHIIKNPAGNKLFILEKETNGITGIIENFQRTNRTKIFSSPFSEWLPQFVSDSLISLTTYAAGNYEGYSYTLDPNTTSLKKVLGPINGLTTNMSPDGKHILISSWENNQLVNKIINTTNNSSTIPPFITLPEKCTWYTVDEIICGVPQTVGNYTYPDAWYKGIARFSDSLQKYTLSTNTVETLAQFPESVDVIRIESDTKTEYVFFMNKNTYELWSYRIGGTE